jgi:cell division protein FtsQ
MTGDPGDPGGTGAQRQPPRRPGRAGQPSVPRARNPAAGSGPVPRRASRASAPADPAASAAPRPPVPSSPGSHKPPRAAAVSPPGPGSTKAGRAGAGSSPGPAPSPSGRPAAGSPPAPAASSDGRPVAGSPSSPAASPSGRAGGPWKAAFFTLTAAAIVIVAVWAILGSSLLVVRSVTVTGSGTVPRAEVLAAAAVTPGTPLARLNTAAVASRVEKITQVQSAQVSREWPDSVVIAVTPRTPAVAVASPGGYLLIDRFGVTVSQVPEQPSGMPLLAPAPPAASLRGSPAVLAAVTVLGQLPSQVRGLVTTVTSTPQGAVTLHLRGGITVVWGGTSRPVTKAAELVILMRTKASFYDISDPATAVTGG